LDTAKEICDSCSTFRKEKKEREPSGFTCPRADGCGDDNCDDYEDGDDWRASVSDDLVVALEQASQTFSVLRYVSHVLADTYVYTSR
tara:strand:- start:194 stop:454 length:261 start_codon:yes stop_codon:yes gene_type:complete